MTMHTTDTQIGATVLAALRMWQQADDTSRAELLDVATDGGKLKRLSATELDTLCEQLNAGGGIVLSSAEPQQGASCPVCRGLGAFPVSGDTCDACLGGGEVIAQPQQETDHMSETEFVRWVDDGQPKIGGQLPHETYAEAQDRRAADLMGG